MHPTTLARSLSLALLLSACTVTVRAKRADRVEHAIQTAAPLSLDIETRNGSVSVVEDPSVGHMQIDVDYTAGGRDEFEAEERVAQFGLDVNEGTGGTQVIRLDAPGGWQNGDGAKLYVTVPEVGSVRVRTSNGRIVVQGGHGDLVLDTSNGRVVAEDTTGQLEVHTSNGSVEIAGHVGSVDARTSNGSMKLVMPDGNIEPFRLKTSNGSVKVELGQGWHGEVAASTNNGSISHLAAGQLIEKSKRDLVVLVGGPGVESKIGTSNGSVTIRER